MKRTRVLKKCLICNKEFWKNLCRLRIGKGKYCSKNCYGISKRGKSTWNKGLKGLPSPFKGKTRPELAKENHWNWRGGISKTARLDDNNWNNIRKAVYERDEWKCQSCSKHCREDIQCHHIIPWRISHNDSLDNLVTLCQACHIKTEQELRRKELQNGLQTIRDHFSSL